MASVFGGVVAFVVFTTFPRVTTPLRPTFHGTARQITGFSTEAHLNDIGRLHKSGRVVMRVVLRVGEQPIGGESLQPYFRGMTYDRYNGRGWEDSKTQSLRRVDLPTDGEMAYFRGFRGTLVAGTIAQEYMLESGALPCLPALTTPVAVGAEGVRRIQWRASDDVLLADSREPTVVRYRIVSVPSICAG